MKIFFWLCLACLAAPGTWCQSLQSVSYYVSPSGQKGNSGTMDQPFARPEDAWNAVVALKKPVNATIYLRGGSYSFSNSLTLSALGTDTVSQVSFVAYQNEKVQFIGGITLDNKRFTV